jgi:flagella basal body P-ring formation protein FlgA
MFAINLFLGNKIFWLMKVLPTTFVLLTALISLANATAEKKNNSTNSISVNRGQTVELKSSVVVDEAYIVLGDLFTNTGGRSAIKVAYAPQAGKKSQFDAKWLYRIARAYKLNWRPLSLKTRVLVERSSQIIYRDEIEDILVERFRAQGYQDNFEIEFGQREPKIHVAANEPATIDIEGLSITKSTGRFVATLLIPANKTNAKRFRLTGRIHRLIQIPVIGRRLNRGDIIQKNDIEWINLRERKLRRGYIQTEEEIIGMAARRYIAAKTPLTASHMQRPQLVKKGGIVNIALISGAMRLTTQGRSLENGSLGDTIRIKNIRTKKIIEAKVTGASSAKVGLLRAMSLN